MLLGQRERFLGGARRPGTEPHFAGEVAQDRGEGLVVLDHQEDAPAVGQRIAVVIDAARHGGRRAVDRGRPDRRG